MKTPPSPDPKLLVRQLRGGRWTWCYCDSGIGLTLESNESYASREEAADWSRRAYPDLDVADGGD